MNEIVRFAEANNKRMRQWRRRAGLLFAVSIGAIACGAETDNENPAPRELAARNAQDLNVTLEPQHLVDDTPKGPEGIYRTPNGYAITDNNARRVIFLDDEFNATSHLSFEGEAQGIVGVDVNSDVVTILDAYSSKPAVLQFRDGRIIDKINVGGGDGTPTGLIRDDRGLVIEYENGVSGKRVESDGSLSAMAPTEYFFDNTRYALEPLNPDDPAGRTLHVGNLDAELRTANYLGTARILGGSANGVDVLVEDVTFGETLRVTQSVLRVTPDGSVESIASIPAEESEVYIQHGIAARSNHKPVAMTSRGGDFRFWEATPVAPSSLRLNQSPSINPIATPQDEIGSTQQPLITYPFCLSQANMTANANEYLNVSVTMTAANINNPSPCDETGPPVYNRTKPAYLGSPGVKTSVSYDWGGWDTPAQFVSAMANGYKAGNMNNSRSYGLTCTYGVDCSGFTARVWGVSGGSKPSTSDLATSTYSSAAYGPAYYTGDAFVNAGVHVAIYVSTGGSGLNIWESVGGGLDRVVYRNVAWSYVSGWSGRHSSYHCNY